ncbi:MAG: hypothetical protein R3217_00605 [Gammaproteobacteria bacterium]|nr:hypothetical protein [Gammaproteobacteria bacterium]
MLRFFKSMFLLGIFSILSACGSEPPATFASAAEEISRIEDAGDLSCDKQRPDYWFCQGDGGFAHLNTAPAPGVAQPLVSSVMLEGNADVNAALAELYGFTPEDVAAVSADQGAVTRGGFTLLLDPTWKQPVVRGAVSGE